MRHKVFFLVLTCFFMFLIIQPAFALIENYSAVQLPSPLGTGHTEEDLVEVYDESGNFIFSTCMGVSSGDRYINEGNNEYEVTSVEGKRGIAKYKGKVDLLAGEGLLSSVNELTPLLQAQNQRKLIGIYHTHSAESYVPGPVYKPHGEVYNVGAALKAQLEKDGVQVIQSQDSFLPHDGGAYDRSRRAAVELLKKRPDAIFDVHRDAIPRKAEYLTQVNGQEMSKVRLVVGRQNPNINTNDQMAKRLKAIADEKYPGLIKGIFYANGKYNQELSPRCLLLEMGTHVTTKEEAQASTAALSDSIYTLLYGAGGTAGGGQPGTNRAQGGAGWRNLFWVIGIGAIVAIGFLFLNEGGLSGVSERLKKFGSQEFANFLGRFRRRRKK